MKRKAVRTAAFLLSILMMTVLLSSVAFAEDKSISALVINTNQFVQNQIDIAVKITTIDNQNQDNIDKIAANLLSKTEQRVTNTIEQAAKSGVQLSEYYIPVQLGDTVYQVDPFYYMSRSR